MPIDRKELPLTKRQYQLLAILALRKGMILTKEMILNHLYGGMDEPEPKVIDVFICHIRKKIEAATGGETYIETVWGRGYVIQPMRLRLAPAQVEAVA